MKTAKDHINNQINNVLDALPNDERVNHSMLKKILEKRATTFENPNTIRFMSSLATLPNERARDVSYKNPEIQIDITTTDTIKKKLKALIPWRKGPFKFGDITINSEWQSNLKWDRFNPYHNIINNKRVIDIGCGNGYYMFKMCEHNPKFILGIDPSDLTYFQFHAAQHFISNPRVHYLPIGWENLEPFKKFFEVVFCMGIMYHHRSPVDLFKTIRLASTDKMTLFFDTLIIDGKDDVALFPKGRYAQMPNIYFIPTLNCLKNMLSRAGLNKVTVLSVDKTTPHEQRSTEWTYEKSLHDFLDPNDTSKTIEGYPAPLRVALIAEPG